MAIGQTVEVEIDGQDAPVTMHYTAVDLRRYEGHFKKSVLVEPMSLTMLTYLAWSAGKREGSLNGEFTRWEAFDAKCVGVKVIDEDADQEAAPDPTQPETATPSGPSDD
jgi:hypothetical protein